MFSSHIPLKNLKYIHFSTPWAYLAHELALLSQERFSARLSEVCLCWARCPQDYFINGWNRSKAQVEFPDRGSTLLIVSFPGSQRSIPNAVQSRRWRQLKKGLQTPSCRNTSEYFYTLIPGLMCGQNSGHFTWLTSFPQTAILHLAH